MFHSAASRVSRARPAIPMGPRAPGLRCSLASATPIVGSNQATKTHLYVIPFEGKLFPLFKGNDWVVRKLTREFDLAFSSNAGHSQYHQNAHNFPIFGTLFNGNEVFGTGPAWSNDTAVGTGAGTSELEWFDGIPVNKYPLALRIGSASGDMTHIIPARHATHIGDVRMSADGQTEMLFGGSAVHSPAAGMMSWLLWNRYNRRPHSGFSYEAANSWNTNVNTFQAYNSNNSLRATMVQGEDDMPVRVDAQGFAVQASNQYGEIAIGLDSSTTPWLVIPRNPAVTSVAANPGLYAVGSGLIGKGKHYLQLCEIARGSSSPSPTVTFFGDNSGTQPSQDQQSGLNVTFWC